MNSQENNLKIDDGKRKKLLAAVSGPDVFIFRGTEDKQFKFALGGVRLAICHYKVK